MVYTVITARWVFVHTRKWKELKASASIGHFRVCFKCPECGYQSMSHIYALVISLSYRLRAKNHFFCSNVSHTFINHVSWPIKARVIIHLYDKGRWKNKRCCRETQNRETNSWTTFSVIVTGCVYFTWKYWEPMNFTTQTVGLLPT